MKVKLIFAETYSEEIRLGYDDDYTDIVRHIVTDYSGFEEMSYENVEELKDFVQAYNRDESTKGYAFLIFEDARMTSQQAIEDIRKKRAQKQKLLKEEREKAEKERAAKAAAAKAKKELKSIESKRKQLEKLKKELGE